MIKGPRDDNGNAKFSRFRAEAMVEASKMGLTYAMIATAGGIEQGALKRWRDEGARELEELLADDPDAEPARGTKAWLFLGLQQGRFIADMKALKRITSELEKPDGDLATARWWLSRRQAEEFANKSQKQIVGADGGAIKINIQSVAITPREGFRVVSDEEKQAILGDYIDSLATVVVEEPDDDEDVLEEDADETEDTEDTNGYAASE